jgi:hypothetical protein
MDFLSGPIDATDPGSHLWEELQQMATRLCSFFLFACELMQIAPHKAIHRGVLFDSNSPDLLQHGVFNRERNVSGGHAAH